MPSPANVPALGLITSGEGVGDYLSGDDEAAPSSSSGESPGDRLRVAKDAHDFLGFWDPGNLDAIPWSDLSYNDDSSDLSYTYDEVVWCKETIRYLRGLLDNQGLIDRGLPVSDLRRTSRCMENAAAAWT